jgi:hypothetical protein
MQVPEYVIFAVQPVNLRLADRELHRFPYRAGTHLPAPVRQHSLQVLNGVIFEPADQGLSKSLHLGVSNNQQAQPPLSIIIRNPKRRGIWRSAVRPEG